MGLGPSLACVLLPLIGKASPAPEQTMKPIDLRCEFRVNPLGVDARQPRLSWVLKGNPETRDQNQVAYRILVASSLERLRRNEADLWDSGRVSGRDQNNIAYAGLPLQSGQTCFWKVCTWSEDGRPTWGTPSRWEMGLLKKQDWIGQWLTDGKSVPTEDQEFYNDDPAPVFRKEFNLRGPVRRARLFITGLGYYEASINGKRIGDHVLDPGWTKVDKRTFYSVYDVSRNLKEGRNCLGAMLGNGWYNPLPLRLFGSFNLREHLAIGRPRLIAQLQVEYHDGTTETIATDRSWKVSDGPILRNNVYLGEVYDARNEQPGWSRAGFNDANWRTPALAKETIGPLVAQPQPPIRITAKATAVRVTEPKPGVYIYDCGVNSAGWVRLKLNLRKGTRLHLRYGELLHPDGSLNPMTSVAGQIKGNRQGTKESIGGPGAPSIAWQEDTFIAKGGPETYTPRFTFHGFRFVEITGLSEPLPLTSVTALHLGSDVEEASSFECSNPMLNQIQEICLRTFKSNIFSVQSDCPHRERLGYGGDIVATSGAMMANFDMEGFYAKVVRDWSDSALPDGMFTDTAPFMGIQYCGLIWAMAHPLLIDQLHQYYGDRQLGESEYAAAKRWLGLVEKQYPEGIVTDGLSDHESLAPAPSAEMVTPLYFQCAKLLEAQAKRLGLKEDERHFADLAHRISSAYQDRFVDTTTGKVGPGTQASQSFALYTGIAQEASRKKILDYLLNDIKKHNGHLTTGILGTKFMLDVLSREGHADVAYQIVTQPDFPGWGWMLKNGATTLWEHWEYSDNTFSHNHPMFGSVSQWMMQWLGGIQPDSKSVGFDQIVIRPQTPAGLNWVKSRYRSIRGEIVSNWSRQGAACTFEIVIPPNCRAKIILPNATVRPEFTVGSGHYTFTVP